MTDKRIAYGAYCTWWDTIKNVDTKRVGNTENLPCCPYCKRVLLEMDEENWWEGVNKQEEKAPGYRKMIIWAQGRRCYDSMQAVTDAYTEAQKI